MTRTAAEGFAHIGNGDCSAADALVTWSDETYRTFGLTLSCGVIDREWLNSRIPADDRIRGLELEINRLPPDEGRPKRHSSQADDS